MSEEILSSVVDATTIVCSNCNYRYSKKETYEVLPGILDGKSVIRCKKCSLRLEVHVRGLFLRTKLLR